MAFFAKLALELFNSRKFIARLGLFRRWLVGEIHHHFLAVPDAAPDFLFRSRIRRRLWANRTAH